ncbi:DUF485 domain-containing inner membrane protein YjcH [Azospirillaceae bacterium]
MQQDNLQQIVNNPKFQYLVKQRSTYAWALTFTMLAIYFGFILTVAFAKSFLATPLFGGIMTVGIPVGVGVILSAFVLTGIYVRRANTYFDDLNRQVLEELK